MRWWSKLFGQHLELPPEPESEPEPMSEYDRRLAFWDFRLRQFERFQKNIKDKLDQLERRIE